METREYMTWRAMKYRCSNPNDTKYAYYGGRGIRVCKRWMKFANFLADMGERPPGHSIDRIDGTKGYEPGNCRWVTKTEQNRNRRTVALTLEKAAAIRQRRLSGEAYLAIAKDYGISRRACHDVCAGKSWI